MTVRGVSEGGTPARGTVVMIAYYYPPLVGIAAERAAAFVRHLPSFGWRPVVVAPRAGHYHRSGEASAPAAGGGEVIRTWNPELSRLLRRAYAGAAGVPLEEGEVLRPVQSGGVGNALRRLAREYLYVPDAQVGWIVPAARAALRALVRSGGGPRVVFSSSVPFSAHVAAARAARRAGVAWVADFRDPWTVHDPAFRPRSAVRRAVDRAVERRMLRRADHVIVTAERTRRLFMDAFPWLGSERVTVIRNGFEPLTGAAPPAPSEPMTVVHAGTLQARDDVRPVAEAIAEIEGGQPGAIRLVALGPPDPWGALAAEVAGSQRWLEPRGIVTPEEARAAMHSASALLLTLPDARFADVVSGKLMEYLGARRPIVGAVPRGSEMEELIREHGDGWLLEPHDRERARIVLLELLAEHRAGRLQAPRVAESRVAALSRRAGAEILAGVLDRVTGARGAGHGAEAWP